MLASVIGAGHSGRSKEGLVMFERKHERLIRFGQFARRMISFAGIALGLVGFGSGMVLTPIALRVLLVLQLVAAGTKEIVSNDYGD